jgi:hypothetical protein
MVFAKNLKKVKKFFKNSAGEINWMFRAGSTQDIVLRSGAKISELKVH